MYMLITGQTVIHLLPLVIYQNELLTGDKFIKYIYLSDIVKPLKKGRAICHFLYSSENFPG